MSLFESTVVIFYVMLHVSCVSSYIFSDEVAAVEEFVKVDHFYCNTIPAFVERGNKDNYDGRQKKAREKRNTHAKVMAAAQLPVIRLWRLTTLLFRNMFSTEPVDGDPPLTPPKAAEHIAMMLQKGINTLKGKKEKYQDPTF